MRLVNHAFVVVAVAGLGCAGAFAQHGHGLARMEGHEPHAGHMAHAPVPASVRLANHPAFSTALSARLAPLLPAGTNIQTAATGFRTLGQFVAAVHASHNLNIPFAQLQAKMTGPNAESLGHAIKDLQPTASNQTVKADVKQAKQQARQDVEESAEAVEEVNDVH
jgi:hypothetical protein